MHSSLYDICNKVLFLNMFLFIAVDPQDFVEMLIPLVMSLRLNNVIVYRHTLTLKDIVLIALLGFLTTYIWKSVFCVLIDTTQTMIFTYFKFFIHLEKWDILY